MKHFAQNWLTLQCQSIADISSALFLLSDASQKSLKPAAQWPADGRSPLELVAIAKLAIDKKGDVINSKLISDSDGQTFDYMASPIYIQQKLLGVVAVKTAHHNEQQQQQILHALDVGKNWLSLPDADNETQEAFYMTMVKLAINCLQHDSSNQSLTTLITELSLEFSCQRVSIGEVKGHHARVVALSNSANFDHRSHLIRSISTAMDESISQQKSTVFPPQDKDDAFISTAHADLARKFGCGAICTIPFVHNDSIFAVLTMERAEDLPFDQDTINICEQTLALISPYLVLKKKNERWWIQKLGSSLKNALAGLFGFHYLGLKLSSLLLIALVSFAAMTEGDFRINADAVLEGKIQRVISAPMAGFIESASVRAGDIVTKGDVIATMESNELELEKIKLQSQLKQLQREHREAMADRELVQVRVIDSQIAQLEAKIELSQEQLQRTQIEVPFDGVIIEGDLSQSLGAPIERGESLFKIAPLQGYRVILKVKEHAISYIQKNQSGQLALASLPNQQFPLQIKRITSVANTEDGNNIFRVEATLLESPDLLRPGMEGIGKVDIGQEKLLWIWTHELIDWLKLKAWSWWP